MNIKLLFQEGLHWVTQNVWKTNSQTNIWQRTNPGESKILV